MTLKLNKNERLPFHLDPIILNTVEKQTNNNKKISQHKFKKFKSFVYSNALGKKKSSLSKAPYIPEEEDKTPWTSNTNDKSTPHTAKFSTNLLIKSMTQIRCEIDHKTKHHTNIS